MAEVVRAVSESRPDKGFLELLEAVGMPTLGVTEAVGMNDEDAHELYGRLFDMADRRIADSPPCSLTETLTYDFHLNLLSALNGGRDHMEALQEFGYEVKEADREAILEALAVWLARADTASFLESQAEDASSPETAPRKTDKHVAAMGVSAVSAVVEVFAADEEEFDDAESLLEKNDLSPNEWVDEILREVGTREGLYTDEERQAGGQNSKALVRGWRPPQPRIRVPAEPFTSPVGERIAIGQFTLPKLEDGSSARYRANRRPTASGVTARAAVESTDSRVINTAPDDSEWEARGLCAQTDPEAFFPEKGSSTREAKRICSGCDVQPECLDDALKRDERFGVRGGLTERERRRLRRGEQLTLP